MTFKCRVGIHDRDKDGWCTRCHGRLPEWYVGWRWSPRLWYWNFYYDGNHHVVQIVFLQIEFYT